MSIREDIDKVQKKAEQLEKQSFAMELLQDERKQNKRLFIIWIITFISFLTLLAYTIYLLNDINSIETIQEVTQENGEGNNNYIGHDGDING